ncbi:hypothetical protein [Egbenema bharatensis]|uniref:hypothetical protein n=1 Tax=Egbenema bharatensis TaxID=3463334 RepID=UPI003A866674
MSINRDKTTYHMAHGTMQYQHDAVTFPTSVPKSSVLLTGQAKCPPHKNFRSPPDWAGKMPTPQEFQVIKFAVLPPPSSLSALSPQSSLSLCLSVLPLSPQSSLSFPFYASI